ncbi:hypothetical protein NFI96_003630 [Prochilodus magdalenae]|nr:hypothetical protein NFI96_003630 [Prochilodus magdalenae]
MMVRGKQRLSLKLGHQALHHNFWLAPIEEPCILGLDLLAAIRARICVETKMLEARGEYLQLRDTEGEQLLCVVETGSMDASRRQRLAISGEPPSPGGAEHAAPGCGGGPAGSRAAPQVTWVEPYSLEGAEHAAAGGSGHTQGTEGSAPKHHKGPSEATQSAVWELWSRSCAGLGEEQQLRLWDLLQRFVDVFAADESECTRTDMVEHRIDTGNAKPTKLRPHRLPWAKQQVAEQKIREMADAGVIEPSNSPWAAPVVLVRKKNGDWRFCVDYRRLNAVTKTDSYPLPRIDDTLDRLAGSQWFSSLDLRSGYWQVALADDAKEKTAFTMGGGLWHFRVMAFGLCNAPATFERLMERVLAAVPKERCVVYLDDVLVHAPEFDEALECLEEVFKAIRAAKLKLHPKKCSLLQRKVAFLGHIVTEEGVATDPAKVEAVQKWPTPANIEQLRSFLGLASYYRRFVRDFASHAAPLHRLTEKGASFNWGEEQNRAFQLLRAALVSAPVLALPRAGCPFIVDTDASNFGIGAVLSQEHEGQERVLAYFSRGLSKPERNYCVTRRELLAVVAGLKRFRPYLYGTPFTLRTDHASLTWLMHFKEPEGQMARWLTTLQEYQFQIVHREGKKHNNADALSRRPCSEQTCRYCERLESRVEPQASCARVQRALATPWSPGELRTAQEEDAELKQLRQWLRGRGKPEWSVVTPLGPAMKALYSQWQNLEEQEGLLYRRWESPVPGVGVLQLLVPQALREAVLRVVHGQVGVGHFGVAKTLRRLRQGFYWPGCSRDVELFVRCCTVCTAKKGPTERSHAPLQMLQSGAPMERVGVDVLGPFPETERGNKYVLVAMDYFTKWPEAYAVPDQSAVTTANCLVDHFFSRFGAPEELHSDQGRNFEAEVMQEVCARLGITKTRTTPLHPQSDGLVERFNRTLATQLAMVVESDQSDWDLQLPLVLWACRTAVQESTKFTPALLMLGRELRTPVELVFGAPPRVQQGCDSMSEYARDLLRRMEATHQLARGNQTKASERQKRAYDVRARGKAIAPGTAVWLFNPKRRKGKCPKLQSDWEGPYTVTSQLSDVVYRIKTGRRFVVVHRDRLAPFVAPVPGNSGELPSPGWPVSGVGNKT